MGVRIKHAAFEKYAKRNGEVKAKARKRILFLADRNILVDQARTNDFKYFGDVMTKITNRTVDKSFEIYLCLYQAVTGTEEEAQVRVYRSWVTVAIISSEAVMTFEFMS